jgi:Bifunctional DNA primase/polymerase, N-terminal
MTESDNPDGNASSPELPTPAEAMATARNLARNLGYAVFPVRPDKRPACRHGFEDATREGAAIEALWRASPGPLIGIATGTVSGVWVLDLDVKHPGGVDFWHANRHRILPTRVYRTRSGGLHCYFRDGGTHRNTTRRPVEGVDTRGIGGYVVAWFAAGFECLDASLPAPWPAWLSQKVAPPKVERGPYRRPDTANADLRGLLDKLAGAAEGERNALLFWTACRLSERGLKGREIEALLLPTAGAIGLSDDEARRTIASAGRVGSTMGGT